MQRGIYVIYKLSLVCHQLVSWCSWLSHLSNTQEVSGSIPDETILTFWDVSFFIKIATLETAMLVVASKYISPFPFPETPNCSILLICNTLLFIIIPQHTTSRTTMLTYHKILILMVVLSAVLTALPFTIIPISTGTAVAAALCVGSMSIIAAVYMPARCPVIKGACKNEEFFQTAVMKYRMAIGYPSVRRHYRRCYFRNPLAKTSALDRLHEHAVLWWYLVLFPPKIRIVRPAKAAKKEGGGLKEMKHAYGWHDRIPGYRIININLTVRLERDMINATPYWSNLQILENMALNIANNREDRISRDACVFLVCATILHELGHELVSVSPAPHSPGSEAGWFVERLIFGVAFTQGPWWPGLERKNLLLSLKLVVLLTFGALTFCAILRWLV